MITLIDNSLGMISVLEDLVNSSNVDNFRPICIDLLHENIDLDDFDVIYRIRISSF